MWKNKTQANFENFVLRERLVDKNGWQHYVYQADSSALHGIYTDYVNAQLGGRYQ